MTKILFLGQFPPPFHGVSALNENIRISQRINKEINFIYFPLKSSSSIKEIVSFSPKKYILPFIILYRLFVYKIKYKFEYVYFTITPSGIAFLRDALFVLFLKIFKVKFIFHLHGLGVQQSLSSSLLLKYIYYLVFNRSDVIILSKKLTKEVKNLRNIKIHILNNGIGTSESYITKDKINKPVRILFLSNLIISKGILELINAIEQISLEGEKNFIVIIVGAEGDLTYAQLEEIVTKKNIKQFFKFLGAVYGEKKEKLYKECDVFVLPTLKDTFPLVILEAMRSGLPIISTDTGAISEIIDNGNTGFILQPKDTQMLIAKVKYFIKNPAKINEMGAAAKKKYDENYTAEIFERNFSQVLKKILSVLY